MHTFKVTGAHARLEQRRLVHAVVAPWLFVHFSEQRVIVHAEQQPLVCVVLVP